MEIKALRYFLTVAHEGSISGASRFLNVAQPALSRRMKELEEELGKRLFIRGNRNISLTAEGMTLRSRAEEIIEMADRTKAEFQNIPDDCVSGDIYIGGGETHGMRLIAETVTEIRADFPSVRFHLYSGNAEDVTERLDKGLLDFGILIQPTDLSKYNSLSLPVKDIWGVVMAKDCALAAKKSVSKKDLAGLPLILSRQAVQKTATKNAFVNWFGKDVEKLNVVATYNLVFNAALLAERGAGYVITLDRLIDRMGCGNVRFRPLTPVLESNLDIVWKKHQIFSPAATLFLETLRKKCV